jgi:hypothetical protein
MRIDRANSKEEEIKVDVPLLDGIGLKDKIEGTDEMIVVGLTSLSEEKCGKECDGLTKMFQAMGPTMKGFYDSYLLEVNSQIEKADGKTTSVFEYFNVSDTDIPAVLVFPYGGKSLSIKPPENVSSDQMNGMDQAQFVVHSSHVKLYESSKPLHLNSTYTSQLVESYEKRPKSVHTLFLMQLPNRVDILDGDNITKWSNEVLPNRNDWQARAILSSAQDQIPPLYTKLAIDFCCSGRIRFGFIKGKEEAAKGALEQLNVTKLPTLMIAKGHALGTGKDTEVYTGGFKLKELQNWAMTFDKSRETSALVPELSDEGLMQRHCSSDKDGWCIILCVPDDPEKMEDAVETFRKAALRRYPVHIPVRFVWLHGGKQDRFLSKWNGEFDTASPMILAVKTKGVTPMYQIFNQAEFDPVSIRKSVIETILEQAPEFKHLGEKMTMLKRERPTDLSRVMEEALEREEAELDKMSKKEDL